MTRRPSAERFDDLTPPASWPPSGEQLAEVIRAVAHPRRRMLLDTLVADGPATVGHLARRTQMAPGSASHHLRVLAAAGFAEPAPELAGDTRESWWRAVERNLTWGSQSFPAGSAGAELARVGAEANVAFLLEAIRGWLRRRDQEAWQGSVTDTVVRASQAQLDDLATRVAALHSAWAREVREDPPGDGVPARGVRAVSFVFPEVPGA